MSYIVKFQIGKSGLSPTVIEQLNSMLKHHKQIRISVLPSSGRNRDNLKEMAETLVQKLAFPCRYTLIGFTIILRRSSTKDMPD